MHTVSIFPIGIINFHEGCIMKLFVFYWYYKFFSIISNSPLQKNIYIYECSIRSTGVRTYSLAAWASKEEVKSLFLLRLSWSVWSDSIYAFQTRAPDWLLASHCKICQDQQHTSKVGGTNQTSLLPVIRIRLSSKHLLAARSYFTHMNPRNCFRK